MKTTKDTYPVIGKTVSLDPKEVKTPAVLRLAFYDRAIHGGWTSQELQQVKDFLIGKSYEKQLEIINHYCQAPQSQKTEPTDHNLTQEDVQFLLSHLNKEIHYLFLKPLEVWDEYDWSNYHTLEQQATKRIVRKYAFYDADVKEGDKYRVTSPPALFFTSYEEAEKRLPASSRKTTSIYGLWIQE